MASESNTDSLAHQISSVMTGLSGKISLYLHHAAAYQAAIVCNRVEIILYDGSGSDPLVLCRGEEGRASETRVQFFVRIVKALESHCPGAPDFFSSSSSSSSYLSALLSKKGERKGGAGIHYYFGRELEPWAKMLRNCSSRPCVFVNLRSEDMNSAGSGTGMALRVNGANVEKILCGIAANGEAAFSPPLGSGKVAS